MVAGGALDARISICLVGRDETLELAGLERRIVSAEGETTFRYPAATPRIDVDGKVTCHTVVDRIETEGMAPGEYVFSVSASTAKQLLGQAESGFRVDEE